MKFFTVLLSALLLSGCALLSDLTDDSAEAVGKALAEYCANMPMSERPAFKAKVEEEFGGTIDLVCPE